MLNNIKKNKILTALMFLLLGVIILFFILADNYSKPDANGNYSNKYKYRHLFRATAVYLLIDFILISPFILINMPYSEKKELNTKKEIIEDFICKHRISFISFIIIPFILFIFCIFFMAQNTVYPCNSLCQKYEICQDNVCVCKQGFTGAQCQTKVLIV